MSSSGPEFRPIHSEIIFRNLMTDFLEATSLPVNVPIHRSREASRPSTPMREEYDRCTKQLPFSLARKLISAPSIEDQAEEENELSRWVEDTQDRVEDRQDRVEKRTRRISVKENKNDNLDDLMFQIDL